MYQFDCLECGKNFQAKDKGRKFCRQSCSSAYSGRIRFPNGLQKSKLQDGRKPEKHCLNCGNELQKTAKFYCNGKCLQAKRRKDRLSQERDGCSDRVLKKELIEKHGAKCMKCDWCEINPVTNKVPIELNHIDGNSENSKIENLELLCPNCHSLTSNFRSLNRGRGRVKRMERYRQGKSW